MDKQPTRASNICESPYYFANSCASPKFRGIRETSACWQTRLSMTSTIQSLAIVLLPIAIPFVKKQFAALQQYRTVSRRPYTNSEIRRLQLLALTALFYIVLILRTLFTQEKTVYQKTGSRLATSLDVLKRRLASDNTSVLEHNELWSLLETQHGILIYLRLGSAPLLRCRWCSLDSPTTYLYFVLGGIVLKYLGHLFILSLCTNDRSLSIAIMASIFGLEIYARAGGFDENNSRSKAADDIIFIDYYAVLARQCFFLWTLAMLSIKCYLDARFSRPESSLSTTRKDLIEAVEKLRAGNSMQRSVCDHRPFRSQFEAFWARNEASTSSLNLNTALAEAQTNARERQSNGQHERLLMRDFIEHTAQGAFS